jgi:hypothetical protein
MSEGVMLLYFELLRCHGEVVECRVKPYCYWFYISWPGFADWVKVKR